MKKVRKDLEACEAFAQVGGYEKVMNPALVQCMKDICAEPSK